MKLLTYQIGNTTTIGALTKAGIVDLRAAYRAMSGDPTAVFPHTLVDLFDEAESGLAHAQSAIEYAQKQQGDWLVAPSTITLLPPIVRPGKVICLGINYAAHAKEGGAEVPKYPMLFHKTATSLIGHNGTILIPPITEKVDYEGELAIVIGKRCKQVSEAEAFDYVAGYTIANDVSARDLQRRTTQFTSGKMLDTFCPLGPVLITKEELKNPGNLGIKTILNGRVVQNDTTANMIFNIPFTISYISQIATLEVGDIILTGTPEGVGFARKPPLFLNDGDLITVSITGIGVLTNNVAKQAI